MTQLTLNNQQLLFVRAPMEAESIGLDSMGGISAITYVSYPVMNKYRASDSIWLPKGNYVLLGTIQKENGKVSTTIEDEVLEGLHALNSFYDQFHRNAIEPFVSELLGKGLTLQEGDKYVVLKIK